MNESSLSDSEMLKYVIDNGIIDMSTIQKQIEMNERKKYFEQHEYKIWKGSNNKYYTYLPDEKSKRGIRLLKRTTEEALNDAIIEYYKSKSEEPTVKYVFDAWINEKLSYGEIQKQSYDKYQNNYIRFFESDSFKMSDRKIRYIDEETLETFIKTIISEQNLSQKAYSDMRILINGIFKYAKKHGYTNLSITQFMGDLELSRNIFKKVIRNKEDEVFFEDEIPKIIQYLSQENDIRSYGLLLVFQSGLRVGELSALKPSDIRSRDVSGLERKKNYIFISRTEIKYRDDNNKWKLEVRDYPKSDAGVRNVIITEHAVDIISRILQINPTGEFLFMENGCRIRGNAFNKKLNRVCKALNINKRTMHKIRKTYGTTLLDNNVDEAFVAETMGHQDISTTRKFYYYSNKSDKTKVTQIENALANF